MTNLYDKRKVYAKSQLLESQTPDAPFPLFQQWMADAEADADINEANAMSVSTIDPDGCPRTRMVLLKAYSEEGFVFFTNYNSKKGRSLFEFPKTCLHFFWPSLERQVIIKGNVSRTETAYSEEYFQSRPRGSQLGAVVSEQSNAISNREYLEVKLRQAELDYEGKTIDKPLHWGGFLVEPYEIEFWQGRPSRLHDRIMYQLRQKNLWIKERLAP